MVRGDSIGLDIGGSIATRMSRRWSYCGGRTRRFPPINTARITGTLSRRKQPGWRPISLPLCVTRKQMLPAAEDVYSSHGALGMIGESRYIFFFACPSTPRSLWQSLTNHKAGSAGRVNNRFTQACDHFYKFVYIVTDGYPDLFSCFLRNSVLTLTNKRGPHYGNIHYMYLNSKGKQI